MTEKKEAAKKKREKMIKKSLHTWYQERSMRIVPYTNGFFIFYSFYSFRIRSRGEKDANRMVRRAHRDVLYLREE